MAGEGVVSTYVLSQELEGTCGNVHSTFRSSMNVQADGFLLHIGATTDSLSCLGIAIPENEIKTLLKWTRRGDLAFLSKGVLRIYSRAGATRIEYGDFKPVDTTVPPLGDGWCVDVLRSAIAAIDFCGETGLPPSQDLAWALRDLSCAALGARGVESVRAAARFLVGRGLGLTPSGDDFLAGYGTALRARSLKDLLAGFSMDELSERTTDVSAAYLRAMAEGHANSAFIDLVRSLRVGDGDLCQGTVAEICSVGHTSGHDSLLGFVVGMGLLESIGGPGCFACESRTGRIAS